jgi:hypothetical protein
MARERQQVTSPHIQKLVVSMLHSGGRGQNVREQKAQENPAVRCQANMTYVEESGPKSGLGVHLKVHKPF